MLREKVQVYYRDNRGRGLPKEGGGTESMNEQQRERGGKEEGKDGEGPRAGPIAMRGTTTKEQRERLTDLLLTCIVKLTMSLEFVHNTMLLCTFVVPQS